MGRRQEPDCETVLSHDAWYDDLRPIVHFDVAINVLWPCPKAFNTPILVRQEPFSSLVLFQLLAQALKKKRE